MVERSREEKSVECDECNGFGMVLTPEGHEMREFIVRVIRWENERNEK